MKPYLQNRETHQTNKKYRDTLHLPMAGHAFG